MTENERVNQIRSSLGLTLEEFGKRLGVTRSAVSNIVNGTRSVTDQMRTSICREYGVRAEWLRDGSGDPFEAVSADDEIQKLADEVMKDSPESFRRRFVAALAKLTPEQWEMLSDIADLLLAGQEKEEEKKSHIGSPVDDVDGTLSLVREQLDDEKKVRERSSASSQDGQSTDPESKTG